jgi:hypothetical protein
VAPPTRNNPETKPKPFLRSDEFGRSSTPAINEVVDQPKEIAMAAIAKAFSSVTPVISADLDSLKTIALFCGSVLLVSVLMATYGLDFGVF